MMEDVQANIEELAKQLPSRMQVETELRKLPRLLRDSEHVLHLETGTHGGGMGLLAVTSQRILFLLAGLLKSRLEEFHYETISSVQFTKGGEPGKCDITITSPDRNVQINNVSTANITQIADDIRKRVEELQGAAQPAPPSAQPSPSPAPTAASRAPSESGSVTPPETASRPEPAFESQPEPQPAPNPGFDDSTQTAPAVPDVPDVDEVPVPATDRTPVPGPEEEFAARDEAVGTVQPGSRGADRTPIPREIDGANIVVLGVFDPAKLQPAWFAAEELISSDEARVAEVAASGPDLTVFSTEHFEVQVTPDQLVVATADPGSFGRVSELVLGALTRLGPLPIGKLGLNRDNHFLMESDYDWHEVGHRLVPPENWDMFLGYPVMRSLQMQGLRYDERQGAVFVRVEPSVRVQPGLYIQVNDHFDLADPPSPEGWSEAMTVIGDLWDRSIQQAEIICRNLLLGEA